MKVYTEIHPGVCVCGKLSTRSVAANLWFQNPMSCNLNLSCHLKMLLFLSVLPELEVIL